jgi:hypothetical protein
MPSVTWSFEGDEVVLRANVDMDVGTELSVSYIEDEHMHKPTDRRREYILYTGKGFTCGCVRCSGPEHCRYVICPSSGCKGLVQLGKDFASSKCKDCARSLTEHEFEDFVAREMELDKLLNHEYAPKDDEEELDDESSSGESDDDTDGDDDITPPAVYPVDKIGSDVVEKIRNIATSGRWLAPAGHWLSYSAYGLLKDVAWRQKAEPGVILACLDARADFVRHAYGTAPPNQPPVPGHGWELLEAAELLLRRSDGWSSSSEFTDEEKRKEAAEARLEECLEVLEPMLGPEESCVVKARRYLATITERAPKRLKYNSPTYKSELQLEALGF